MIFICSQSIKCLRLPLTRKIFLQTIMCKHVLTILKSEFFVTYLKNTRHISLHFPKRKLRNYTKRKNGDVSALFQPASAACTQTSIIFYSYASNVTWNKDGVVLVMVCCCYYHRFRILLLLHHFFFELVKKMQK